MVMHTPTGLFIHSAYGQEEVENAFINVKTSATLTQEVPDSNHWYLKGGLRKP
jgi:hypothetical protein